MHQNIADIVRVYVLPGVADQFYTGVKNHNDATPALHKLFLHGQGTVLAYYLHRVLLTIWSGFV